MRTGLLDGGLRARGLRRGAEAFDVGGGEDYDGGLGDVEELVEGEGTDFAVGAEFVVEAIEGGAFGGGIGAAIHPEAGASALGAVGDGDDEEIFDAGGLGFCGAELAGMDEETALFDKGLSFGERGLGAGGDQESVGAEGGEEGVAGGLGGDVCGARPVPESGFGEVIQGDFELHACSLA